MSHTTTISSQCFFQECLSLWLSQAHPSPHLGILEEPPVSPFLRQHNPSLNHQDSKASPRPGFSPPSPPLSQPETKATSSAMSLLPIPSTGLLRVTLPALRPESPHWPHLHLAPSHPLSILQPNCPGA